MGITLSDQMTNQAFEIPFVIISNYTNITALKLKICYIKILNYCLGLLAHYIHIHINMLHIYQVKYFKITNKTLST